MVGRTQKVVLEGNISSAISVGSGVPQGTVLGPLLFLLYINDLPEQITSTSRLFADDCLLYTPVSDLKDHERLQRDLDKLAEWQRTWQMQFNPSKCYVMHISLSRNPPQYDYHLCGQKLEVVRSHPYLGIHLQSDLGWGAQVGHATAKANRMLGVIKRNLYACPEKLKEIAYKGLVRPHVEYAAVAWDPYRKGHITDLEKVQRSAARFVKRNNTRTPGIVTELLNGLGWESLADRRRRARLLFMYKIRNGLVDVDGDCYLKPLIRHTRHSNSQGLISIQSRIDAHKYSFFPRTIIDWNSLSEKAVSATSISGFRELM